jgi:RHS repeat-associated protein
VTGSVNTGIAGTYQLVYAVVDSHGLSAARMIRTVVVHVVNNPTLTVKTLVVGGGGGGANTFGGGGAGGYRYDSAHAITSGTHSITVGAGGLGSANSDGGSSVFDTITSIGGGAASNGYVGGHNGASGGGGYGGYTPVSNGGTGTSGQGSNGGNSTSGTGGGGGGSSATGTNGASRVGGSGGNGTSNSITGSSIIYAGGGAGRGQNGNGTSGTGGGGVVGSSGAVNTGGGAGASNGTAMDGGSGVVIISYHTDGSDGLSNTSTGGTKTTSGAYTIHTFTSSGTFTANVYTPANDNPIITLTSSNLIEKTVGDTWTEPGYSAADTEDGNLTSSVSVTGSVNTGIAGTYQLVYAVVDSQGAQAARIIRTVVVFPANDPQTIDYKQNIAYTYDANGNITQAVDASNTNASKTVTYTYDDLNRMTQAVATNVASGQSTYTQNFTYNAIGNIITGPVGSYTYAGNSGTNYANPHAATSINSVTNTYDHDGNVLTDGTLTNTWNYKDQLTETTNGTFTRDYKYDEGGNRVSSTDGTTTTVYLNKYYNNDGTRKTKSIYAGDQLFATIETVDTVVTPYYDHADYLNSVAVVSDSNGSSVQILDYMPYGSQRINSGSKNLDRQYLSQIYDSDSSLNYLRARFYQSLTGRFISEDPMFWQLPKELLLDPQQQNSYSYGRDNPISVSDPSGKVSTWALFNPLTYLQVGIGSLISDAYASLRPNQSRATTELFSRSLSINPSNLTITENSNDSYIINQIKNSSEYNAFINNVISNADKNGDSSINAIYKGSSAGSSGDSIGFTKGDLFTAIGGTLSTQVNGQKQKDGSWNLNLGIQDRYNFQPKDYKNVAANTANNTALIPQALGVVSNYNININFKDTKKK